MWRLASVAAATLVTSYPPFLLTRIGHTPGADRFAHAARWTSRWSRSCLGILRIPVEVEGTPPTAPCLIAPNHTSYLDILALSSVYPMLFAPKADVADWPLIGHMTRMSEHVFITRRRTKQLQVTLREITERLSAGTSVCVFLEGTTTGGADLLPFKPAFIQPAVESRMPVVPVGVRWWSENPAIDPAEDIAYWKDHHFPTHIKRLAGLSGIRVKMKFGEPIDAAGADRRELAPIVRDRVGELLGSLKS